MNREVHARFCGRLEVKSLRPTRRCYLYRATDRSGALVDVRLSETRDMAAARAFLRSARVVTGVTPARVTTDGHDGYLRAIRTGLDGGVKHRTNQYLYNRIEQDHRGIKGRYGPMRGFKSYESVSRFRRGFDELRNHLSSFTPQQDPFDQLPPPSFPNPWHRRAPDSGSGLITDECGFVQPYPMARLLTGPNQGQEDF